MIRLRTAGALALAFGVAAAVHPAVGGFFTFGGDGGTVAASAVALAVGSLGLWSLWRDRSVDESGRDGADASDDPDPETIDFTDADAGTPERVGAEIDEYLARIDGGIGDVHRRRRVRERLYDVAVDVLVERRGYSREAARRAVETGAWTDDPRAAVAVGGSDAAWLPVRTRVRDWVRGYPFERRVERAVAELSALAAFDGSVEPDEREGRVRRTAVTVGGDLPSAGASGDATAPDPPADAPSPDGGERP